MTRDDILRKTGPIPFDRQFDRVDSEILQRIASCAGVNELLTFYLLYCENVSVILVIQTNALLGPKATRKQRA